MQNSRIELSWLQNTVGETDATEVKLVGFGHNGSIGDVSLLVSKHSDPERERRRVLKRIQGLYKLSISQDNKLAREAYFLNQFGDSSLSNILPTVDYAFGDMKTGEKVIIMEELDGAEVERFLDDPKVVNPFLEEYKNNGKVLPVDVSVERVLCGTVASLAQFHAFFWKNPALREDESCQVWVEEPWLLSERQANAELRELKLKLKLHRLCWEQQWKGKSALPHVADSFIAETTAMLNGTSQSTLRDLCNYPQTNGAWTLVHGDFHAGNALWINEESKVKLVDFEMVRIGSPLQDLSYFLCCRLPFHIRRRYEKLIIQEYYNQLIQHLKEEGKDTDGISLETLWQGYLNVALSVCLMAAVNSMLGARSMQVKLEWALFLHENAVAFFADHYHDATDHCLLAP